jgi:polar amino acid transport system ATP-binding protein
MADRGLGLFAGDSPESSVNKVMVDASAVWKRFGSLEVLRGIDLRVHRGEVMAIIGPSGSGKSTFLRCINHLETVDSGQLLVDGELVGYRRDGDKIREVSKKHSAHRRAEIGMVFQSFNLFPHMTALENVTVGPVRVRGENRHTAQQRGRELLRRVGLLDKCDVYPRKLSGGQSQRVAIARALAMEPKLMLFDEPTSALDPEMVGEVLDVMRQIAESGMTSIVVTHEMGFARDVADSLVLMADGIVVESGPPNDVMTNPQHERSRRFIESIR